MTTMNVRVPAALKNRLDKLAEPTIRKGKKDVQSGRIISHENAARWLRPWGRKHELPVPSFE